MATQKGETFKAQDPHKLNDNERKYIEVMNSEQKKLHELAVKMLGSSYFVGKTHGYTKWIKEQQDKKT
jgi:hypothetical protein